MKEEKEMIGQTFLCLVFFKEPWISLSKSSTSNETALSRLSDFDSHLITVKSKTALTTTQTDTGTKKLLAFRVSIRLSKAAIVNIKYWNIPHKIPSPHEKIQPAAFVRPVFGRLRHIQSAETRTKPRQKTATSTNQRSSRSYSPDGHDAAQHQRPLIYKSTAQHRWNVNTKSFLWRNILGVKAVSKSQLQDRFDLNTRFPRPELVESTCRMPIIS